jgi:hypothetical protein
MEQSIAELRDFHEEDAVRETYADCPRFINCQPITIGSKSGLRETIKIWSDLVANT